VPQPKVVDDWEIQWRTGIWPYLYAGHTEKSLHVLDLLTATFYEKGGSEWHRTIVRNAQRDKSKHSIVPRCASRTLPMSLIGGQTWLAKTHKRYSGHCTIVKHRQSARS